MTFFLELYTRLFMDYGDLTRCDMSGAAVQYFNICKLYLHLDQEGSKSLDKESSDEDDGNHIRLKGQMMYMMEWECIIFLATPM